MKKRMIGKGIVLGVILLFVGASFLPSISGNTTELDKKQIVKSQKQVNDQKEVLVTCYNFGLPGKPLKQIEMSQYEAEYLYEKIKELNYAVAEDPLRESTQQLQIEIIDLADEYDLLPTGLSKKLVKEKYIHVYKSQTNRIGSLTPKTQSKASAFFCNFAIAGTGSQTPVIILPRLIPIIQLPIPRIILRWNALDGIASCGGLRSGTGFIAMGQQTGTALGFWGIGFSIFLPPFMQYGFIGYALYASANAEIIELWPPNYPPEISHITPDNGEMNVSISLSELQFEISDFNGDRMSYTVTTTPDIGSGSGNLKSDGVYSVSISGLEDLTEYSWHIEVTDGMDTTTKDSSFTTEAIAPIISDPSPIDGSRHTSVDLDHLSFHLKDFQGDSMDCTVETSPDIGSGSEDEVEDGTYTISVNGLDFDTEYSWYVNVTDGTHWTYKVFHFKTRIEPGPWWDDSWSYRKYLGIMDTSSDYQMVLRVWMEDGHANPENINIDCENHCNEDFSDIRFVTFDGVECKYWIEEIGIDGGDHYAIIWVKTPSSSDEQLYLYYGNPDGTDQSSADDTFIFFDDCENGIITDKWILRIHSGTMSSYSNNRAYNGVYSLYQDDNSFSDPTQVKTLDAFIEPSVRIYGKFYQTNDHTGSDDYHMFYTYDDETPIETVYFKGDGDIEYYYDGTVHDTGYNFIKEGWNDLVLKLESSTNYAHIFVNGQDCGDIKRNDFDKITQLLLGTSTGYKTKGNWDNILICKWTSNNEPVWESFGPEETGP